MSDFVRPDVDRLTLPDGAWIDVRRRLTTGETRAAYRRCYFYDDAKDKWVFDPFLFPLARITAYLLEWSLVGEDGQPMPLRSAPGRPPDIATLEGLINDFLPHERFLEIRDAILAHEAKQEAARAEEKKTRSGKPNGKATSRSPSAPDGTLTASAP